MPPSKNLRACFVIFTAPFRSSIPAAHLTPISGEESCHFGLTGTVTGPTLGRSLQLDGGRIEGPCTCDLLPAQRTI